MKKVIIIDFGSQYTMLIARRIREIGVYSEIVHPDWSYSQDESNDIGAIVLSGGPKSVTDTYAPKVKKEILESHIPILGICYGHQLISYLFGGKVIKARRAEYGFARLKVINVNGLFEGLPTEFQVWMSHGDEVIELPPGFVTLARTEDTPHAVIKHKDGKIIGLQFHPEVVHTEHGTQILQNFLFKIAGLKAEWRIADFIDEKLSEINRLKESGMFLCALSGGVDSSVLTQLLSKADPHCLVPVFVDTGLLKWDEPSRVRKYFGHLPNLQMIDASERFFNALNGVTNPEEKRAIIGALFGEIFKEVAQKWVEKIKYLAQGTLYPDVIESGLGIGPASRIKTHHNVGGLPKDIRKKFQLYEPFKNLFKDEVRKIGKLLGLPDEVIYRHPFPGPGFAVRVMGEVNRQDVELLRRVDKIIDEEVENAGLRREIWQLFPVLLPVRSVGVIGDERTYGRVVVIRAVTSVDGMTADWFRFPHEVLRKISNRITGELRQINRVVYDITSKPPGTIEWE